LVTREAKSERKVHGDARHQPKHRDLRCRGVQLVLEQVRRLDIQQITGRRCQREQQGQPAEIQQGLVAALGAIAAQTRRQARRSHSVPAVGDRFYQAG
jgi:hypothetical protein